MGIQTASGDGPAQPLYFFLQCNGPLVGLPHFSEFIFGLSALPPPLWGLVSH